MYNSLSVLVSNLALVKPDKAKAVENYLIQMARMGQLGGKVSHFYVDVISGGKALKFVCCGLEKKDFFFFFFRFQNLV